MKIRKVLIANRGEIACRIIRTLNSMKIQSVAVYSDIDSDALHTSIASESVYLGPGPPSNNYLNAQLICKAAVGTGADSIHPGFGFLSENADFAELVEKSGLLFIGPRHECIRIMGNKLSSKKFALDSGVNTIKGYMGEIKTTDEARKIAKSIGFPVLVKAVAGGGGKGMRKVNSLDLVEEAYELAKSEALKSFGDDRVFMEQYVENPRHIEIQVIADKYGEVVCLGERECSIQRRHQKIVEEAPSTFIDDVTREKMYAQSTAMAKKIKYSSAGTIEFVVDKRKKFYFLEMNTRIQVEHPVTELVTGIDIVREMIEIAEGRRLGYKQDSIKISGWAVEARVYAEDPSNNFMPSIGRLLRYAPPHDEKVRVDSGVREGDYISMYYDPMIAKVCSYGKNRKEAVRKLQNALSLFVIYGLNNNLLFLESVLSHPRFIEGQTTTSFIRDYYPQGFNPLNLSQDCLSLFIGVTCYLELVGYKGFSIYSDKSHGHYAVRINDEYYPVFIPYMMNDNHLHIECDDHLLLIHSNYDPNMQACKFEVNGVSHIIKVRRVENYFQLSYKGMFCCNASLNPPEALALKKFLKNEDNTKIQSKVFASITGMVVKVYIQEGDKIAKGDPLLNIEAMKMENTFYSKVNAIVKRILIKEKDTVQEGDLLLEFKL